MTSTSSNRSFLKYASLFILVFQNSALVLIMKLSRSTQVAANAPAYTTSTAVVMSELIKLLVSVYFLVSSSSSNINSTSYLPVSNNSTTTSKQPTSRLSAIFNDLFGPKSEYKKVLVPALLYYIQNNLQYIAVSLLDAATFQVTYQLKILTTALFSVGMLGKRPSVLEWVALFILTAGVAMVQLPTSSSASSTTESLVLTSDQVEETMTTTASTTVDVASRMLGLMAVIVACILSGLAGVWFEKVLKGSKASLWVRNTQLALFSLIIGFVSGVFIFDRGVISEKGFFYGYTGWTWSAILCQAVGGLIVAMVVKYADNILKGFATSVSIVLSSILSIYLFEFKVSTNFLIGASLVLYSTYLYQCEGMKKSSTTSSSTSNSSSSILSAKNGNNNNTSAFTPLVMQDRLDQEFPKSLDQELREMRLKATIESAVLPSKGE